MNRFILLVLLISAAVVLLRPNPLLASPVNTKTISKNFEALITKARAGDVSAAEKLAKISLNTEDVVKIDDAVLRDLASLLNSNYGAVRMWTAAAMGNFGHRAVPYVPRLQQIVSEEACNMTGLSAADTASAALQKMGLTPNPFGCIHDPLLRK